MNTPRFQSLVEVAWRHAAERPDGIAYTFLRDGEADEWTLTYRELDAAAGRIADALLEHTSPGERALLLYEPGLDFATAFFGCLYAGVLPVPAYPPDPLRIERSLPRLAAIVADAQAAVVLGDSASLRWGATLLDGLRSGLVSLDTSQLESTGNGTWRGRAFSPGDVAFLQYTSGSTGTPKGVMITHGAILYQVAQMIRWDVDDAVGVHWLPTYHDLGLVAGVLLPMYANVRTISMSPHAFVQRPLRWLQAMSRYRATTTGGPNFAYDLCVRRIREEDCAGLDLSHWTHALNGGEPVRPETLERFVRKFAPFGLRSNLFRPSYGMAETTLGVSGNVSSQALVADFESAPLERPGRAVPAEAMTNRMAEATTGTRRLVGCGRPLQGTTVRIVDPRTRVACEPDQVGEVWVRSPSNALGYWGRPDETRRTFRARIRGEAAAGRFLRTGDLGFLHQGELFVTGRVKDLIIIAGRNHYPQDIERTVAGCDESLKDDCGAAFSVPVEEDERLVIVQELRRRSSQDVEALLAKIREQVLSRHGIAPFAISLIKAGTISKTTSGKIQRRECRQEYLDACLQTLAVWREADAARAEDEFEVIDDSPRTPVERRLAQLWSETLGVEHLGRRDSFFALGGQSLAATRLAAQVHDEFGVELSLGRLLADPTIAGLAALIEQDREHSTRRAAPIPRGADDAPPVASFAQERLWLLAQLAPEQTCHAIVAALRVHGELDTASLQGAHADLVERHDSLRTTLCLVAGGVAAREAPYPLEAIREEDWSGLSLAERSRRLETLVDAEGSRPFDLVAGPLIRLRRICEAPGRELLVLAVHHLAADGWSISLIADELASLYESRRSGGPPPSPPGIRHRDYAAWQRQRADSVEVGRQLDAWESRLRDAVPLSIPLDRPRADSNRPRLRRHRFSIGRQLGESLAALAQSVNATSFMAYVAAFQAWLGRVSGQTDISVGTPVSGRDRPELSRLVGCLVNPVVLRADLADERTFLATLEQARAAMLVALEEQGVPFGRIVERLAPGNRGDRQPLFQAMLVLQELPSPAQFGGLRVEPVEVVNQGGGVDLVLELRPSSAADSMYDAEFVFDGSLWDDDTVAGFARQFVQLLESAIADPRTPVFELNLCVPEELRAHRSLAETWRRRVAAEQGEPSRCDEPCVPQAIEAAAARFPDRTAVVDGPRSLTYAELDRRSLRAAQRLRARGVAAECLVALSAERSIESVVATVAVLRAGGAVLPLNPREPASRRAAILGDAQPRLVLSTSHDMDRDSLGGEVCLLDELLDDACHDVACHDDACHDVACHDVATPSAEHVRHRSTPDELAYVIYTSGSTGTPKGVLIEHRGWSNSVSALRAALAIDERARVAQTSSPSFDGAFAELAVALTSGATLVLPSLQGDLALELREQRVTHCFLPPSAWAALSPVDFPDLEVAIAVGERCPGELARRWRRGRRFVNGYGPTEASICATLFECTGAEPTPPIGAAIPGVLAVVLDGRLQPVPRGVPGELCLGGAGLARGYLGDPERTARRFVETPQGRLYRTGDQARMRADGQLEFLGRLDEQVKLRGFRIELGEIEAAAERHPEVEQAVAVVREDLPGRRQLVCYVRTATATPRSVWEFLRGELAPHAVPSAVVPLDMFPRSLQGKIDRRALPAPTSSLGVGDPSELTPRTRVEEILTRVWQEVLGHPVGIHDNFFDAGGDSIQVMQASSRAQLAGLPAAPRLWFDEPTIAGLARAIEASDEWRLTNIESGAQSAKAAASPHCGPTRLLPMQRWFFAQQLHEPQRFHHVLRVRLDQRVDPVMLADALSAVLATHDGLRQRFERQDDEWRSIIAPVDTRLAASAVRSLDLRRHPVDEALALRDREETAVLERCDLEHGPLLQVVVEHYEHHDELWLAAHHLIVDGVSWRIVLGDLVAAYEQRRLGVEIQLPAGTRPANVTRQDVAAGERLSANGQAPTRLPRDLRGDNRYATAESVATIFDTPTTRELQSNGAPVESLLMDALFATLRRWMNEQEFRLHIERHGRDLEDARTVGWLTRLVPITLRATTDGAIVHEEHDSAPPESLELVFAYHGRVTVAGAAASVVGGAMALPRLVASPQNHRPAVLEVNACIVDDQLRVEWCHNAGLHHAATISRLAADFETALRGRLTQQVDRPRTAERTDDDSSLVTLRRGNGQRPLFLIHPAGGQLFAYRRLVAGLDERQTVFGLQARGLAEPLTAPAATIEELAEQYLGEVRGAQPRGPYHLAGWSLGGLVAYELGRRLEAEGERVAWVALLDIGAATRPLDDTAAFDELQALLPREQRLSLAAFATLSEQEQVAIFAQRAVAAGLVGEGVAEFAAGRMLSVLRAHAQASRRYRPPRSKLRLAVFQTQRGSSDYSAEWADVTAGGVTRHGVPGDHLTMMQSPHVERLAAQLQALLDRAATPTAAPFESLASLATLR